MTGAPLLLISGSLRKGSLNRKLLAEAARHYGGEAVTADLRMPLYDGDLEDASGVPAEALTLHTQIKDAAAIVIATPEYNQSFSGVLKNALDWVSRIKPHPWTDKPVAIISAAAGRTGGARAQYALRLAMTPFQPNLLSGPEVMVAMAHQEFDADGRLTNIVYDDALSALMEKLRRAAEV